MRLVAIAAQACAGLRKNATLLQAARRLRNRERAKLEMVAAELEIRYGSSYAEYLWEGPTGSLGTGEENHEAFH